MLMVLTMKELKLTAVSRLRSIRPSSTARDIFLEKVGFKDIFHQLNYKGIFELLLFEAIPSLKLSFNPHQAAVSESLNRLGGGKAHTRKCKGVKYSSKSLFLK